MREFTVSGLDCKRVNNTCYYLGGRMSRIVDYLIQTLNGSEGIRCRRFAGDSSEAAAENRADAYDDDRNIAASANHNGNTTASANDIFIITALHAGKRNLFVAVCT
jgi:hypothetical protein